LCLTLHINELALLLPLQLLMLLLQLRPVLYSHVLPSAASSCCKLFASAAAAAVRASLLLYQCALFACSIRFSASTLDAACQFRLSKLRHGGYVLISVS